MKLNRTKVLVVSLVVITLLLGGVALYIANRLQTQIQTPSSASTTSSSSSSTSTALPTAQCQSAVIRMQPNSATGLTENLSVNKGQPFNIVIADTATGGSAGSTGIIRIQKPDGTIEIVGSESSFNSTAGYTTPGTYIVFGTLGTTCITNYAILTVYNFTGLPTALCTDAVTRVQSSSSNGLTEYISVNVSQTFSVVMANPSTGGSAGAGGSFKVQKPDGTVESVGVDSSWSAPGYPKAGTYVFIGYKGTSCITNYAIVSVKYNFTGLPTTYCPRAVTRLQPNATTPLTQFLTIEAGKPFNAVVATIDGVSAGSTGILRVEKPDGTVETVGSASSFNSTAGFTTTGTYTFVGTLGTTCLTNYAYLFVTPSTTVAVCKQMTVGTSLTNQAKKNTRESPLSVAAGSDIYITHTISGLEATDRTRYLRIYNGQNKTKNDGTEFHNYVSYNSNDNAFQKSTGTGTGDIVFTFKLKYSELFQVDNATLGFPQTPAEKPQWAKGEVPNYVKVIAPVKPFINGVDGTFGVDCQAYIKRADVTVTLVNTSTSQCVGLTIGKNGGTQSKKNTRESPLLLAAGDTLNVTHTLSNVPTTENSRVLRIYNAQNISADGNNTLNSFTSYNSTTATFQTANKVANGSNSDFKYTITYDQLFKADSTALVKAATPAETPQWASGGIPNLVKIAVPVKPFSTGIEGTFDSNCLGYISRVGISLAGTSGGTSGGSNGSNGLPSTDLSSFNILPLIAGAILLLGGITLMKYRSRFENI